jgi:DNA-binding NarL/FixJ family response regulator
MRAQLTKIVAGERRADVLVTPLKVEKKQPYFLIVFRPPSSLEQRVAYAARLWDLTERQSEVLALIAAGFANKTIAARLSCTERNVEAHLTAIYAKSGISGRTALVASLARDGS